ncbi:hypothetical protein P3T76_005934 [Phytophthora citrophthora]|uniref:Uncharacterized protein n=1 Tax=Phytophthora citrophthora TaxID=4793 RepID=A0AAD9GPW2_9STRA|nr:hypothetical protein P3T76_005934 [Phytophthora citrophthora]
MSRSEADDVPGSRRESCEEKGAVEKDCCRTGSPLRDRKENETSITVSNQDEAQLCEAAVSKSGVAADPVVITKIVDFCEELKKQNEDVKKQLLEQHAVLTSLHSTLAVEADGKADVTRRRNVSKSQLKAKPGSKSNFLAKDLNTKPAIITSVMCRPRPARGETKIPLPRSRVGFSLRSAGADIVKGSSPEVSTRSNPEMLRAEAKVDNPTCCDEIPAQTKVAPPDSPHKGLSEELDSQLCETKACSLDTQERTKSQEGKETCALKGQNEKEETDDRHEIHAKSGDDEKPMDTESKFVHHWESQLIGDELLECTSISILDGPSSLVSLDQSFRDLFH